jgi:hypothetical protein
MTTVQFPSNVTPSEALMALYCHAHPENIMDEDTFKRIMSHKTWLGSASPVDSIWQIDTSSYPLIVSDEYDKVYGEGAMAKVAEKLAKAPARAASRPDCAPPTSDQPQPAKEKHDTPHTCFIITPTERVISITKMSLVLFETVVVSANRVKLTDAVLACLTEQLTSTLTYTRDVKKTADVKDLPMITAAELSVIMAIESLEKK